MTASLHTYLKQDRGYQQWKLSVSGGGVWGLGCGGHGGHGGRGTSGDDDSEPCGGDGTERLGVE